MGYKVVLRPGTRKGVVFVAGTAGSGPPTVTFANGQTLTAVRGDQAGGTFKNNEGQEEWQYVFKVDDSAFYSGPFKLSFNGETTEQSLEPGKELRTENGGLAGLDPAPNKAIFGGSGGGGAGAAGGLPNYLGGQYPQFQPIGFQPVQYQPIPQINYDIIDPQEFGKKYGEFNRGEFAKNFGQSKDFALKNLQTELQGLKDFVPAASALKRKETAADNVFNQEQRTRQIQDVLPDVQAGLKTQTADAATFSKGRFTSDIEDRALETGLRSDAADISRSRGFGDNSTAARKSSDLLSAKERFQVAQYGNQLKETNSSARQQLELAPTAYSDAGQQVRVTPTTDAGSVQRQITGELNQLTTISAPAALSSLTQQGQYKASEEVGVNKYNATNTLQNDQFNTTTKVDVDKYNSTNSFAAELGKFNYDVGYSNAEAGLQQAAINQTREDAIRDKLTAEFGAAKTEAQKQTAVQNIIGSLGAVPGLVSSILEAFGYKGTAGQNTGTKPSSGASPSGSSSSSYDPTTGINTDASGTQTVSSPSEVPSGFTGVQSNANGGVTVVPNDRYSADTILMQQELS